MFRRGLGMLGLLWMLTGNVHAQSASDYARVAAPDVAGATAFLDGVMGCDVLDGESHRALLACGYGSVVEIVEGGPAPDAPVLRLRTEDVGAASAWLRKRHISSVYGGAGTPDGLRRIDVRTPWGQTLELLGRDEALPPSTPLAAE